MSRGGDIAECCRDDPANRNDHAGDRPVDRERDAQRRSARGLRPRRARRACRRPSVAHARSRSSNVARSGGNGPRRSRWQAAPDLGLAELRELARFVGGVRSMRRAASPAGARERRLLAAPASTRASAGGAATGGRRRPGAISVAADAAPWAKTRAGAATAQRVGHGFTGDNLQAVGPVGVGADGKVQCGSPARVPRADRRPAHPARREGRSRIVALELVRRKHAVCRAPGGRRVLGGRDGRHHAASRASPTIAQAKPCQVVDAGGR